MHLSPSTEEASFVGIAVARPRDCSICLTLGAYFLRVENKVPLPSLRVGERFSWAAYPPGTRGRPVVP